MSSSTNSTEPSHPSPKPLSERMFNGTLWMFAMSWLIRLLSIVSTGILARLLEKEDFGLLAITSAIVMLPVILLDLGLEQAIVRDKNPSAGLYNTAWTIKIIQMAFVGVCLAISAPWVADFYNDPRIIDILYVLSVMILLRGLENLWVVSFRKNLNFRMDFAYETLCKLLAVVVTIGLAWYYRSYWALVYGQIGVALIRLVLSMIFAPALPRFSMSHFKSLWMFSQWSIVKGLALYVVLQADKLILGRFQSVESVGAYALGREIADLPIRDISAPALRALGPGFAELQSYPERLVNALVKAVNAIGSVTFPIGVGLACTAEQIIPVMLGEGWSEAVPTLQILALSSLFTAVSGLMANALIVIGHVRDVALLMWLRAICFIVLGIPAAMSAGALGIVYAVLASEILNSIFTLICYRFRIPALKKRQLVVALLRPALSVGIMAASVVYVDVLTYAQNIYVLLMLKVAVGVLAYMLCIYIFWVLARRPDTIESVVMKKISAYRHK